MARLLLVDDDISEISAVKRVLSRSGHAPLLATNGSDALASIGQARPDLLLVGATCQGGEALAALQQLDDDEATRGIPVIILGDASGAPERAVHLQRPIDPAALAEQVKLLLSSAPAPRHFERRVSSPALPGAMDRRSGPSNPAMARKAAADALLARARELRRGGRTLDAAGAERQAAPAPAEAAAGLDALFELEPPGDPAAPAEPPGPAVDLNAFEEPASWALFDLPAVPDLDLDLEAPAAPAAPPPPQPTPPPPPAPIAPVAVSPDWERAHAEEAAARRTLEEDLQRLRQQLETDRRRHDEELHTVIERASAHEQAALERQAGDAEATRQAELQATAGRAVAEAEARAATALEQLQARAEAEAARRATAETALARATGGRRGAGPATAEETGAEEPAPLFADLPPLDPTQEAARRRALSRRAPTDAPPAAEPSAEAAWGRATSEPPPAELRAGTLEDLPMARLLAVAWRSRAAGRLDVAGDATRSLWFEDGRVVGAVSGAAGERIDEVAHRLGLLTRDQHRQAAGAVAGLASRRAAVLLVDRGYLKPGELTALVRARTEEVVFGIYAETSARFRWVADPVPADERTALDRPPLALAVEGIRRRWLAPRTEAILGGPATLVTPVHGGPTSEELGLLPDEQRALSRADGLRTLDEVLAASPLDALSTRQLLSALVLIGALGVKVVQAGRPAAQVSAGIDLARVKEKLEQVRRADYFTILGLGRLATPHEVRASAERLTAEFRPERFGGLQEEGLPARLEEIRRVLADAREVLADPLLREEYQRGLSE